MKNIVLLFILLGLFSVLTSCASSDFDNDGLPNEVDECPKFAEDIDAFEDNDGCPDTDNDRDKVADVDDKCPLIAEDLDGFEDEDGCPDSDNDKDGMPDLRDKCPDQAEDRDNFEDTDGCPDLDNDGDGIPDDKDSCALDKEDIDGFQDEDGCPDNDNDGDGMPDIRDKCPNEPEIFNGKDDDDGCPNKDSDPLPENLELDISFVTGTSELTFNDKIILDNHVVPGLRAYPEHKIFIYLFMKKVEIGMEEYLNVLNARSLAISDYLQEKGVDKEKQVRVREVTEELYANSKGTPEDFNQNKPVRIVRK